MENASYDLLIQTVTLSVLGVAFCLGFVAGSLR